MFDPGRRPLGRLCCWLVAVAAREIIDPGKFRDGISKIVDGTVECLNASTWAKGSGPASTITSGQ
jgi:hypothetical protein